MSLTITNISRSLRSLSSFPKSKSNPKRFFFLSPTKRPSLSLAMSSAGQTENLSNSAAVVDDDDVNVKFGFKRPEMYKSSLAGTIIPYERHVFLCYKSHDSWPPRVEASDDDPLPKLLASAFKARKEDMKVKALLTICEGLETLGLTDGDILIFPDMIKYRGLKESDVDGFVDDVVVNGKPWAAGVQEELTGSYVFVCAHNRRDQRCGVCGPVLIEKFKEEIECKDLKSQVFVTACSHIGGHKYAGNVIIFSANAEKEISGHWYGYVAPDDVAELLDRQIGKGEIIDRIWRGQMGAKVEKADQVKELKLPNGSSINKSEEKQEEKSSNENFSGCCQGANGVSCCGGGNFEEKKEEKGVGKLEKWIGKWEQRDILTTVALVGAVASVAVAVAYYRRSR